MNKATAPGWHRPLAIGFLAWNLLGAYACFQQLELTAGKTRLSDPYEQALYAQLPFIYNCFFLAAEITGLVGAALLALPKRSARLWFLASLLFITLQFGFLFATTELLAAEGPRAILFPLLVFGIGVIQVWAASAAEAPLPKGR
jgi:hypothetical protein